MSSPRPRAAPISFDIRLRACCCSWNLTWAPRRFASSSSTRSASGSTPRRARPASNAALFSRIHRALNMTAGLVAAGNALSIHQCGEWLRALSCHPVRNCAVMPAKQGKMDASAFVAAARISPQILPTNCSLRRRILYKSSHNDRRVAASPGLRGSGGVGGAGKESAGGRAAGGTDALHRRRGAVHSSRRDDPRAPLAPAGAAQAGHGHRRRGGPLEGAGVLAVALGPRPPYHDGDSRGRGARPVAGGRPGGLCRPRRRGANRQDRKAKPDAGQGALRPDAMERPIRRAERHGAPGRMARATAPSTWPASPRRRET